MASGTAHSSFYRLSAADVAMVSVVLALSAGALFWMGTRDAKGAEGAVATIQVRDHVVETLPLSEDSVLRLRDVGMTFEVSDGRIRVVESDCPQDVCVNTGWISRGGQIIACVPNRVVVRVEEREGEPFLDAIAQ